MSDTIETNCCGAITRCRDDACRLGFEFLGAAKCIRCGWIWELPDPEDDSDDAEAHPISIGAMQRAHA